MVRDKTMEMQKESKWKAFKRWALKQYSSAESVQIHNTVEYLKALGVKSDIQNDEGLVEYLR